MKIDKAEVVAVGIELGVDRATLTQRRYENWRRLLMEGWRLDVSPKKKPAESAGFVEG